MALSLVVANASGAEEGGGHDTDAVAPTVGRLSRCDDDCVKQVVAESTLEPLKMSDIAVDDVARQFDFDREDAAVAALDDQVDLVLACGRAQVLGSRLSCLCVHTYIQGDEGLEQGTEQRAVAVQRRTDRLGSEKRSGVDTKQTRGESRIDELVFRWRRERLNRLRVGNQAGTGSRIQRRSRTLR